MPLPMRSSAPARWYLAESWLEVARRCDAAAAYDRADALAGTLVESTVHRVAGLELQALIATSRGELGRAESLYREALQADEHNVIVLNNLADVLVRRGGPCQEAVALARQAVEATPGQPSLLDTLAMAELCAGNHEAAEQAVRRALESAPGNPVFLTTLAEVLHARGRTAEAGRTLAAAAEAAGGGVPELVGRIEALRKRTGP